MTSRKNAAEKLRKLALEIKEISDDLGDCGYYYAAADAERTELDVCELASRLEDSEN